MPSTDFRTTLLAALKTAADVAAITRVAVKDVLVGSLKDAGEVAANAAIFAGTVKSAVIGVSEAGRGATEGVRGALSGVIAAAGEVGADLREATKAAIQGTLDAIEELGNGSGQLLKAAAEGMLEGAAGISEQAIANVKEALIEAAVIPREVIDAGVHRKPTESGD